MQDVLPNILEWQSQGEQVALATVTRVVGSAPRSAGAKLALSRSGQMVGSVSGGCLEADVMLHMQETIESGEPKLLRYGIADEMAWEVGLACGGTVDIFIERLDW